MISDRIKELNENDFKFFYTCSGGGSNFISTYLSVSGASKHAMGFYIPYSSDLFDEFIGHKPKQYVSELAAEALAVKSFEKINYDRNPSKLKLGIGVSASLYSDGQREGRVNQAFIVFHSNTFTKSTHIIFKTDCRITQELIITNEILRSLVGIDTKDFHYYKSDDYREYSIEHNFVSQSDFYNDFGDKDLVVYPGSWNPFHIGHLEILELSKKILRKNVLLELSLVNADKGHISYLEAARRVKPSNLIVTCAQTFVQKIYYLSQYKTKSITFVVGADTWERIIDPKYGYSLDDLEKIFTEYNVKFLIFKRNKRSTYIPIGLSKFIIYNSIAHNFHNPASSSQIRDEQLKSIHEINMREVTDDNSI